MGAMSSLNNLWNVRFRRKRVTTNSLCELPLDVPSDTALTDVRCFTYCRSTFLDRLDHLIPFVLP